MSNYTVLQTNLLPTFESGEAKAAFLWACDRKDADLHQYRAEAFAHEVDRLRATILPMLRMVAEVLGGQQPELTMSQEKFEDLYEFIMKRHKNRRFPQTGSRHGVGTT